MTERDEQQRDLVRQEAADWFIANREGLDARQEPDFMRWLRASPVHVQEYLGMALTARDLTTVAAASPVSIEALLESAQGEVDGILPFPRRQIVDRPAAPTWRSAALAAAIAGVLAVALAWWARDRGTGLPGPQSMAGVHCVTQHGQRLTRHLGDGSTVHLNTDTAVTVDFSPRARRITIEHGQATFEVAHDPQRPFRVITPIAEIVAVGTNFDVYERPDATLVTVVSGRVSVVPGRAQPAREAGRDYDALVVNAGEQLRLSTGAWPGVLDKVDAWSATAWLRGQISFTRQPLGVVAAEFNRYASTPIVIDTPALRVLPVSGTLAVDDPKAFLAFLRSLEQVHVEVTPTRTRVWQ